MEKPIINFENFTFQYNAQASPTLKNINLKINQGEKVLIAGASGSGKSTIANCINGMIPFRFKGKITGSLTIDGLESKDQSIFELSKISGTVLQDPDGQFIGLTVGEDIAFALENDCVPFYKIHETVNKVSKITNTFDFLDSAPYELSGGQKQRVSLSGIMVDDVKILLFDEPLANLDPATGMTSIDLIDKIQKDTNSTIIIIEHRVEEVLWREMDRIILMSDGEIVMDSAPNELLKSNTLEEKGIREPLYVTALKYANVEIHDKMNISSLQNLHLNDDEKKKVRNWFNKNNSQENSNNENNILEVQDLEFGYDENKTNLSQVSFAIKQGEMVSIVGKNGAGKTTLSKLICGFLKQRKGEILLNNKNISNLSIRERSEFIGYVMQNPNQMISKNMIYDEISLGLINSNLSEEEKNQKIEKVMKICGIYQFRKWPISALSFGQKKRVTIASVLVLEPKIIILDEPTSGQDFKHYTEIMEFLYDLKSQGITIILITHNMHLMLEYTTRTLVFADGKMLSNSVPAEVLCSEELIKKADLKETSLFPLATLCGINEPIEYIKKFIDYDKEVRKNG